VKHTKPFPKTLVVLLQVAVLATLGLSVSAGARAADVGAITGAAKDEQAPIEKARAAIKRNDWQVAIRDLKALVAKEPRNADAHNLLAFSLRNTGDLVTSKTHYDQALSLDPNHKGAHEYLGELYLKMKQPENAQKHLTILEKLCGNKDCEEYRDLAKALVSYKP
jgi:Flp pilus assembly protein TadD